MKKMILFAAAALVATSAMSQNGQLYLFRNDKQFNYYDLKDLTDIKYSGGSLGYTKMAIETSDGTSSSINMSVVDSCVIRQTVIPDIHVRLTDYPDLKDLIKDSQHGKSFVYDATLRMDGNGLYDDLPEQTVEFRGRGNSTWNFAKTPYRFKMAKKTSVCGMAKAKTFALIANYIDPSLMRNAVALWTAQQLGLPYSNHCIPVNVYLNGYYKGAYMMTEKIGVGGGSVDINEETGMLFELDSNYDEDFKFKYRFANNAAKSLPVMVKDPDLTEIKPDESERSEYFSKWQADFTEMADVVVNPGTKKISDYVDLRDAACFVLVNSLACNRELQHPKSLYLYKEGLGSEYLYHFGPVWDFDWAFGYDGSTTIQSHATVLFERDGDYAGMSFMKSLVCNSEFRAVYKEVWNDFYTNIYPRLLDYMAEYAYLIEPTGKRDGLLWPDAYATSYAYAPSAYDRVAKVSELTEWVKKRVEWCNTQSNWGLY